jgi:hypothetical protein
MYHTIFHKNYPLVYIVLALMDQPSYFFISLVLGPLNSLVWWEVPLG